MMDQEDPGGTREGSCRSWDTPSKERAPGSYSRAGPYPLALLLALIHRSAWKANSQESVYRLLHSPARWAPYGRPETSRLLKDDHYMLHLRIKMRLGAYASSRQDTDYAGAGGGQELRPRVCY